MNLILINPLDFFYLENYGYIIINQKENIIFCILGLDYDLLLYIYGKFII